jgi:GDP-L-fucose synthase
MKKTSKIYIAGHRGLVGSALWKNLQSKGYTNLIGRTLDELDLMDTNAVNSFFETENPEYVILAAAKVGGIVANNTYRGQFIYENLMIQNNVIHAAYLNKVTKLLFLGSTCIYPRDAPQPMPEDCLLTGPLEYTNEPYAIAKIAGIKLCESYNLQYSTNFISVMPTNLYGPNDNFDLEKSHVLPAMVRKMHLGKCLEENNWDAIHEDLNKRPIEGISGKNTNDQISTILSKYGIRVNPLKSAQSVSVELWGTGAPFREFLWSEEMADACVFLMENINFEDVVSTSSTTDEKLFPEPFQGGSLPEPVEGKSVSNEIRNSHINIGTGIEITIRDLANLIKEKIGFKGETVFNTSKPDGTMRKLTDPSKLHSLGWHHKIEIDEGINRLYEWYLNQ